MQASAPVSPAVVTPAELAAELLVVWQRLARGWNGAFFALLEELDLSITHVKTLDVLSGCVAELSVKELSERLGLSLASASRTTDALVRRGWLERREDEHDRRVKRVGVTADGREVVARINGVRLESLERFATELDPATRAGLHDALAAIPSPS